jgi:hypothetical protein
MRDRIRPIALAATLGGALLLPAAQPILAAAPVEVVFSFTGTEQAFVVPAGVTSLHVVAVGGRGGTGFQGAAGGYGARVEGDLSVTPGATLYVEVAGNSTHATAAQPGFSRFNGGGTGGDALNTNRGGGGGGASDIRTIDRNSPGTLTSRLLVAAGGGGGGGGTNAGVGGAAAAAGANGVTGAFGGGAGTTSAGGGGGAAFGASGSLGLGGDGGSDIGFGGGGGGGGAGLYGGGGGGSAPGTGAAGGGGGSSFTGTMTNVSVTPNSSDFTSITVTYTAVPDETPTPDSGVVDADVTVPTSAACIELSTTSVSFGTQLLGGENLVASPQIEVTNCSGGDQDLLARGTNAAGAGATWQLVNDTGSCGAGTLATDDYHLKLRFSAAPDVVIPLSTNNAPLQEELAGGDTTFFEPLIDMPCPGSSGSGQTMGMQIVFVVTE